MRALRIEEGRFLVGECATDSQRKHWQLSKLDLNDCLTNSWGKLEWAKAGNFVMSCRNVVLLDGTVMEAEAGDTIGWLRNVVNLEERIRIVRGQLTFIDEEDTVTHTDKKDKLEASSHGSKTPGVAEGEHSFETGNHTDNTETRDEDAYDSDDSVEDEYHGEVDIIKKIRGQEHSNPEEDYDRSYDLRYEINQWPYHFREADGLWSEQERTGSQQWTELITELDKFAINNARAFEMWQSCAEEQGGYLEQGVGPLHVAANLGLTYWARHLVETRGMNPSVFSGGRNALQAAAISADGLAGRDMLGCLLRIPGADAEADGTSDPREPSALQEWLRRDPSKEAIKLFIDGGVDFNEFAFHYFAASRATNPAALKLIIDSGGTEQRPRPDINAKDDDGNTPLHLLSDDEARCACGAP